MGFINLFHCFGVVVFFFSFKNLYRGERWTVLRGRRKLALAITKRTTWKTRTGTRRPQRQTQKARRRNDQSTRVGNKSPYVIHLLYLNLSKWHIFNESFTGVRLNFMVMVWVATWCLIWTVLHFDTLLPSVHNCFRMTSRSSCMGAKLSWCSRGMYSRCLNCTGHILPYKKKTIKKMS